MVACLPACLLAEEQWLQSAEPPFDAVIDAPNVGYFGQVGSMLTHPPACLPAHPPHLLTHPQHLPPCGLLAGLVGPP